MNTFTANIDDKNYLTVSTDLKPKSFKGVNTSRMKKTPGLLIGGGEVTEWYIEGYTEIDGIMHFYGPELSGRLLSEAEIDVSVILTLLEAFTVLNSNAYRIKALNINAVFLTDNGDLLFFPSELTDFLNDNTTTENRDKFITPWNNTNLSYEEDQAFTLAALLYFYLTGNTPFDGSSRKDNYPSLLLSHPALRSEILRVITDSLAGCCTLKDWTALSEFLRSGRLTDDSISTEEKEERLSKAVKDESIRIKKNRRREFWRQHKTKVIIAVVSAAALLSIVVTPISKALEKPVTLGMTQTEVISLYYESFNIADFETMEDCIERKAGSDDIHQIVTFTAVTKARSAYEGAVDIIHPEKWETDGRPDPGENSIIWGLKDLEIKALSEPDTYKVHYEKYFNSERYIIEDTVSLALHRKAWRIESLSRIITESSF